MDLNTAEEQLILDGLFTDQPIQANAYLNKERLDDILRQLEGEEDILSFRVSMQNLRNEIFNPKESDNSLFSKEENDDAITLRLDILKEEFNQICESHTLDRAKYYLKRLRKGLSASRTGKINDINLLRWKEYDDILTDSLWIFDRRDSSGAHLASYWGNFIPQIPNQMMRRYTKKGDWVLDTFLGSGTTLIECQRLGRNGIGVELNEEVARQAEERIRQERNVHQVTTEAIVGDSRSVDIGAILNKHGIKHIQLLIMHPPYHDIIRFSDDESDLSNANSTEEFLSMFGRVIDNASSYLEKGRYLAVVIGDKYEKGEWIPLGFLCMNEVLKRSYLMKSIVVKNFDETKGKRSQKELWRYRALVGGFYVFKHEYVLIFEKK